MDRFIPNFLTSNNEQPESRPAEEPMSNESSEPILTRSRAANLSVPLNRHQVALAARRSPSPAGQDRFFPSTTPAASMSDADTIRALTEALQGMKASSRKPDLPAFDQSNIELWIKRVDNAYRRAGVTDPKDKFAHIESKFAVDADSRIQAFIFGEGTQQEWDAFMQYLKDRYGRTKSQRASFLLDGVKREGRLPSEMFAFVKEKIGDLTIDDLLKEMVIRELPIDIQRTIHEQTKSLDGASTTKLADSFFDKDGKPIHKAAASAINNVETTPETADSDNEEDDVNAVNRFKPRNRQFRPSRGQTSKPPWSQQRTQTQGNQQRSHQQGGRPPYAPPAKRENQGPSTVKSVKLCRFHHLYGDAARTCEQNCVMYSKWSGNGKAGRQT